MVSRSAAEMPGTAFLSLGSVSGFNWACPNKSCVVYVFVNPSSSAIWSKVLPDFSLALKRRSAKSPMGGSAIRRVLRMAARGASSAATDVNINDKEKRGAIFTICCCYMHKGLLYRAMRQEFGRVEQLLSERQDSDGDFGFFG